MDITNTYLLVTYDRDTEWETSYRRDYFEGCWFRTSAFVLEDAGDLEDVGDALRREERLAEACYEV